MKKMIEYYYNFKNIELNTIGNEHYFNYNNKKYVFFYCRRSPHELDLLNKILIKDKKYNKIIHNIFNHPITTVGGKQYVLVQILNDYGTEKINLNDILVSYNICNINKYMVLLRVDWYSLWTKKVDYILYQKEHIRGKYKIIEQYLDYYLGMAENSISYFKKTMDTFKNYNSTYTLSHRRIKSSLRSVFYNLDDLIIDYPVRTLSEYLKHKFFSNKVTLKDLNFIFSKVKYDEFMYRLLYARMVFPSYFFDEYEKVVNDNLSEEQLINMINRINEYEIFLKNIFYTINKKTRIPQVEWLS